MDPNREDPTSDDLDDFAAECEEHLLAARQVLVAWDAVTNLATVERTSVDALFRHFHTVKGLAAMVGARAAEEPAHHLETYLGALRKGNISLNDAGVTLLEQGVQRIEAAVHAFCKGDTIAESTSFGERVARLISDAPQASEREPQAATTAGTATSAAAKIAALPMDQRAWRVTFTPTAERAARGVNVSTVRERLLQAGTILHAEPQALPTGGVAFHFVLATTTDPNLADLAADGLAIEEIARTPANSDSPRATSAETLTSANLVRVDLGRLDELLRVLGDLVVTRAKLEAGLARAAAYLPSRERQSLEETAQAIERQVRDLREGVMRVRLVPMRTLFSRMRLVVRDLIRETQQDVELTVSGEETEIDKYVAERLGEPLLHLVRNAMSHGLEPMAERTALGKPARGRLALRASAMGGTVVLDVEDDGRGVDADRVFARAREAGLIAASTPTDSATLLDLLCMPGFSTREASDRASGRGVGMDVVRRSIEGLSGSITLETRRGAGCRFTLRLPLTLVVTDVLTVEVGERIYAVPRESVREVVAIESGAATTLENNELLRHQGRVLPLVRLCDLFHVARPAGNIIALIVGEGNAAIALGVDRAIGLREAVVRPLADPLVHVTGFGGATDLGDGRPVLILDPSNLARLARRRAFRESGGA